MIDTYTLNRIARKQRSILAVLVVVLFSLMSHSIAASPAVNNDSKLMKGVVSPPPVTGFTYTVSGGCSPVVVQFYSQVNGPVYAWQFYLGTTLVGTSSDCNPVFTFTTPGTYNVLLSVNGGSTPYTGTITVGANPAVTFGGDQNVCQYDSRTYTATSTIAPASYTWTAQGGTVTSSTSTAATVTWNSYGVNYLKYTITTAAGCTKIFSYEVKVIPPPMVDLPCCDKRGGEGRNEEKIGDDHPVVYGQDKPCDVCAGSYATYTAYVNGQFGTASDYFWNWSVSNGTIDSISPDSTQIFVTWGAAGVGSITLTVQHKIYGCISTKTCDLVISPGITAMLNVSAGCISKPVEFNPFGTGNISDVISYFYEFGDGYDETKVDGSSVFHQYTSAGSYIATLTITTRSGCTYKVKKTVTVTNGTSPTIVCPGTVCQGARACYKTASVPGGTYVWNVQGDIDSLFTQNGNEICVTWGTGPIGSISVTVNPTSSYTCSNTAQVSVAIINSNFTISAPDFVCATSTYEQASTTNYAGACYTWTINGSSNNLNVNGNKVTFNPQSFGTTNLDIAVQVDFGLGCCKGEGRKRITVLPQYGLVPFSPNTCIGTTVTYYLSAPAGLPSPPVTWSVQGGTFTSTPSSITVTWTTVGQGTITAGNNTPAMYCNDGTNSSWNVQVLDKATGDDITGLQLVCAGTSATYYHGFSSPTGSASVVCSGATVLAGQYSSVINFTAPGTYTIAVTYNHASLAGCNETKYYTVKVIPTTIPLFTIPGGVVCQGDVKMYTCSLDSSLYSFAVIGGAVVNTTYSGSILTSIQVQWNSTVTSSLSVTNRACGTTNSQPVTVNGKPVVIITQSAPTCGGTSITLSVAPIWNSYSWSPGGGASASKTVTTTGMHSVTVSNGVCSETGSVQVTALGLSAPVINSFNVNVPASNCCPKYYTIVPNITLGGAAIASYNWTFTGFSISASTAANPALTLLNNPGSGTWSLTITDIAGCTYTKTGSYSGSCTSCPPPPPCDFIGSFSSLYNPCSEQFISTTNNVQSVTWVYGDGVIGSGINPFHTFSIPSCTKTINATVTDINNCVKLFSFTASVPYVFKDLKINVANSGCTGASSLTVSGLSSCAALPTSYAWTVTPSGGLPMYFTTSSPVLNVGSMASITNGSYTASCSVTVTSGGVPCTKTTPTVLFNKGGIIANFVTCGGCAGSPLTFTDQSTPYNAPLIKWQWTFVGPGGTISSFLQNPTITFPISGSYTGTLQVWDNNGCMSSMNTQFAVAPVFAPGAIQVFKGGVLQTGTTFNICPGENYTLQAPNNASYTYVWSDGSITNSTLVIDEGFYSVLVYNANGCVAKLGPIKINFKPRAKAIIEGLTSGCAPLALRAFLGTGYSYNWTYPISQLSNQQSINVNNSGTVSLSVTNLHGCTDIATQSVNVLPSPSVTLSMSPSPFCPGSTVTLQANVTGGTTPYSYLWNVGMPNTGSSILVTNPGTYTCKVTGSNGCPTKVTQIVKPILPNMSNVPSGCYTICDRIDICAGNVPYGWTATWYNGSTAVSGPMQQGTPIVGTFGSSGSYTLHYTPLYSYFCSAISDPIDIDYIGVPQVNILYTGIPILCENSGGCITLTADPQDPSYNYTWYSGSTIIGTGYSVVVCGPGTYTVKLWKSECCFSEKSITIETQPCCFETPDASFHSILTATSYNSNIFWDGKYYIDAIVTVTGTATLDITNVDCVFGPNGKLVFKDRSFFRCNNSVLRPCERDDVWQGTQFLDESSGWINTTTIKNAIIGVDMYRNTNGVRLTDNSFIKCHIAVNFADSRRQQSISGNTFEIDGSRLRYSSSNYTAIKIVNTDLERVISQNNFRHVNPISNNSFTGIYSNRGSYTASENEFNDMHRSIDATGSNRVIAIEKNIIKVNSVNWNAYDPTSYPSNYQIRISDFDVPVLIYQNEFYDGLDAEFKLGAIYLERTSRTHVKQNTFDGYFESIWAVRCRELNINSNKITNSSEFGISLMANSQSVTSCNEIRALYDNNSLSGNGGFGYYDLNNDKSSKTYSNCIFNTNRAMYLENWFAGGLPAIYNNYMYNYRMDGIYNDGYYGSIGNAGGPTQGGRNTFMSNNGATGGTIDINSTNLIDEGGNFGILQTNNVNSQTQTDEYYSTADCANQIEGTYNSNMLDQYNICDIYNVKDYFIKNEFGAYDAKAVSLIPTAELNKMNSDKQYAALGTMGAVLATEDKSTQMAQNLLESQVDRSIAARMLVTSALLKGDVQLATDYLSNTALASVNDNLREILTIRIEMHKNGGLLSNDQVERLILLDNLNDENSPIARDMLHVFDGSHYYKFQNKPKIERKDAVNVLSRKEDALNVYPIPSRDNVSVDLNVQTANVEGIHIMNIMGEEIFNFEYTIQAGTVQVNISSLSSGIYFMTLETDNTKAKKLYGKFIKIQ